MQKKQEYRVGPGASSLLLIFVALCLTTVGILTLISALADTRLSERTEQTVQGYYAAAETVQRELAAIDARLLKLRRESANEQDYADCLYALEGGDIDLLIEPDGDQDAKISFAVPMYGSHELLVTLRVPLVLTGDRYQLTGHTVEDTSVWEPEDGFDLVSDFS